MAASDVEASGDRSDGPNTIFNGMRLWLARTVPQRNWFISQIAENGGIVVDLEDGADVKLVDHTRKVLPPNSYSYKFVEQSLRNKRLANLEDFRAGSRVGHARPVGSSTVATKGGRTPFTGADDQFLWDWVKPVEEAGGSTKGNELYKQIEAANPRHTYQSWRDRWIKYLSTRRMDYSTPRQPDGFERKPIQRMPKQQVTPRKARQSESSSLIEGKKVFGSFTTDDFVALFRNAEDIAGADPSVAQSACSTFAQEDDFSNHTAGEWQEFWERFVKPAYETQLRREREVQAQKDHEQSTTKDSERSNKKRQGPRVAARSPSFQPQSPSYPPVSNQSSHEPRLHSNQARKRSLERKVPDTDGAASPQPAKRKRDELEGGSTVEGTSRGPSKTRTTQIVDKETSSSSTPDLNASHELQDVSRSNQQQAHHLDVSSRSFSPLFYPEDTRPATPKTQSQTQENNSPATSPMDVRLFLDQGDAAGFESNLLGLSGQAPRLPSEELGENNESDSEEQFETAQSNHISESEEFETANPGRIDTQAILHQTQGEFDFGLAEPAGGWAAYEGEQIEEDEANTAVVEADSFETPRARTRIQPASDADSEPSTRESEHLPSSPPIATPIKHPMKLPQRSPRVAVVLENQQPPHPTSRTPKSTAKKPLGLAATALPSCDDLDAYLSTRLSHLKTSSSSTSQTQSLLLRSVRRTLTSLTAATRTSFLLADKVFDSLRDGNGVPEDTRGIWTEEDDEDLLGGDARAVERVRRKHGDEGVEGRWEVLSVIGMGTRAGSE